MKRKRRKGAAAVEFAIIAPVFVGLVLGMLEVGSCLTAQQRLNNAAREGARQAARPPAKTSLAEAEAAALAAFDEDEKPLITVEVSNMDVPTGTPVTVTLRAEPVDFSLIPPFFMKNELVAHTTMRKEG